MRLPTDQERITIVGATGSGKTQFAQWMLAQRDFLTRPWLIYNFKHDESIDSIPGLSVISLDMVPDGPGLYVVHPLPHQQGEVELQMWEIWRRGNIGIYVDEGYMIDRNSAAFSALLTQGRSKYIPMMVLSQRPVWLNAFVFSESNYYSVFRLQMQNDRKKMMEYVPANLEKRLPEYHSYYFDVGINKLTKLSPVPSLLEIHAIFARRLRTRREAI